MTIEKEVENNILQWLSYLPSGFFRKNNSTGIYDSKAKVFRKQMNKFAINGVSDILGIHKGYFIAIEVKAPNSKARPKHQKDFIDLVNSHGGKAGFATCISDVKKILGLDNEEGTEVAQATAS